MSHSNDPVIKQFSLETYDGSEDASARGKRAKQDSRSKERNVPMDTTLFEDKETAKPKVKFNLEFNRMVTESEGSNNQEERFGMETLFAAVSSGDATRLNGLHQYLVHTLKHLTNTEYQRHGKNALIKGLLNLKDGKNDTIEFLLDIAEKMGDLKKFVNAAYTDSNYKGQTALHVAIERRSESYVKLLVQKGADVHARACGKFFQEHDGPNFYFGELPLSLAACTNQPAVVDFLIDNPYQKVDITKTDSQGNTVLHALVLVADKENTNNNFIVRMYDHILTTAAKLYPMIKLEDIENHQLLTPLKLAAKKGKIEVFEHMVHREFQNVEFHHLSRKFTEWVYGPVQSSLYDVTSLDSYENNSVMDVIIYNNRIPNRLEMLQVEPLNCLLNDKWDKFAKWIFLFNFICYLTYLSIFTVVAYYIHERSMLPSPERPSADYLYLMGLMISTVGALHFFIRGISDMWRKCPTPQSLLVDGYDELLFFIQGILFIISAVLYLCGMHAYLGFLVICLALSWVNLLYFSRGSRHLGIYTVIIQKMILGDILCFIFVYIVYLFGFSAALVTLIKDSSTNMTESGDPEDNANCKNLTYRNIQFTILELFKFTIGMGDLEFTDQVQYQEVFYILLISYIVLTYILLLNMIIALMSKTVENISEKSFNIWKLQRAITILDIERTLPSCLRKRLRSGMEKDLGRKPDSDKRWCLSMEEVNWDKWSSNLSIIKEEPGNQENVPVPTAPTRRDRGSSWYRLLSHRRLAQPVEEPETTPMMTSRV
ncbi:transient receptor potential cation channel subfamily V member 1-like [Brienomyrus brachyistius]|uniref:transient receptor potential cation channel subfamily V member 1-like n=1 Tax=Brienomyrus brachyistius TaxID=42636 RepID=UPI0020B40586|nr:transient receptor potential cation channel subfamily V member 1-like [Brienomyrus brachyistius]